MRTREIVKSTTKIMLSIFCVQFLQGMQQPSPLIQKPTKPAKENAIPATVDFPEEKIGSQGNWIRKKEWLKEALRTNEEIQKITGVVQKAKNPYSEKAQQIDSEIDAFYKKEGFEQGKLKDLFASIEKYLEKKKQKAIEQAKATGEQGVTGELEIKIKLIEKDIANNQKELDQLKLDMQSIGDLDKSIHDRLSKVDEQITITRKEADRAEKLTDETWYIIDDKKARNNYYELKNNILGKLKAIQKYLDSDLLSDFEAVLTTARNQMTKVSEEIKNLEEKQFFIKDRAQRIEKIKRDELEGLKTQKEDLAKKEAELRAKQPWYKRLYHFIVDSIVNIYESVKNFFSGAKGQEIKTAPQQQAKTTQPEAPKEQIKTQEVPQTTAPAPAEPSAPQQEAPQQRTPPATTQPLNPAENFVPQNT